MAFNAKQLTGLLLIGLLIHVPFSFAQEKVNRYEVEILANPNPGKKDTRQVNAVMMFEADSVKIRSRRTGKYFKEFKYTDIRSAEHSYSKKPFYSLSLGTTIALTALTGIPFFLLPRKKERHWLTIVTDNDFAVMKVENDNYRMIRNECIVLEIKIVDIREDKR
ncbi:MAG: hypothetical protein IT174_08720 [Acidobacteria bacterium]|nr:hypothetical protein [Acidobacteriota bacterium]